MCQTTFLYKAMLRYGRRLQLTDKDYFYRRVRFEFEKNSILQDRQEIQFQQDKARQFLKNSWLV